MNTNATLYSSMPKSGSPFLDACDSGDHTLVLSLLCGNKCEDINERGRFGRCGLFLACRGGHTAIIQTLITSGADIEQKNDHGFSPLYCAALHNQLEALKILLKEGANIHTVDLGGLTPLHIAAEKGYAEVIQLLLQYGADKTIQTL